jgi:hypothetical protein
MTVIQTSWSNWFAILIALVFIGLGGYLLVSSIHRAQADAHAIGQVVDVATHVKVGKNGGTTYAPVVEFKTPDGETHRFTSRMSSSSAPVQHSPAPVLYDPAKPEDAVVENGFDLYGFPSIFILVGLAALAAALYQRRKQ